MIFRTVRSAIALFAVAAALTGCSQKSRCLKGIDVQIVSDHPHSAAVPIEHVTRTVGGTYPVRGGDHEHAFALKDEDMQELERGETVTKRTSSVNAHLHEVTVRCKD